MVTYVAVEIPLIRGQVGDVIHLRCGFAEKGCAYRENSNKRLGSERVGKTN